MTKPAIPNQRGRIPADRPRADVVNTNIAAMRIAKKIISVLPKVLNWRAAAGSIAPSAYCTLTATTELAAAPTNAMATNRMPLTSCRLDCRAFRRRPDAASHIRSVTMNHRKAIPENGRRYRPTITGAVASPAL